MKNVITIGREYGSGGRELAEKLSQKLGFKLYDKEMIAQLADELMVPEAFVEAADEKSFSKRNIFHELAPLFVTEVGGDSDYIFAEQGRFICRLAEEGNCIFIGRRADYYLRNNPNAMHIYCYADMDFRVKRICEGEACTPERAAAIIADTDKRRRTSYEYTTGRKWGDMHNYDRLICTSTLGVDAAVEEIALLVEASK